MTALALPGQTLLYPMSDMSYSLATPGQLVFKKLTVVCNIPKFIRGFTLMRDD